MTLRKTVTSFFLLIFFSLSMIQTFAADPQPKAAWYRYYDSRGVANVSTSVTPAHISYGYEALDRNMQVIRKNRPYNAEADVKKAPERAAVAKSNEADLKLKKAYTNSTIATQKKTAALLYIKKQINFQQDQLKQLQDDRIMFKRQEMEHLRKGSTIPVQLKNVLEYNQSNITMKKELIHSLQTNYRNTQAEYDKIIIRLKAME